MCFVTLGQPGGSGRVWHPHFKPEISALDRFAVRRAMQEFVTFRRSAEWRAAHHQFKRFGGNEAFAGSDGWHASENTS